MFSVGISSAASNYQPVHRYLCILTRRCRAALEGGREGIKAEAVVLPDGEQYKSTDVLMQASALA